MRTLCNVRGLRAALVGAAGVISVWSGPAMADPSGDLDALASDYRAYQRDASPFTAEADGVEGAEARITDVSPDQLVRERVALEALQTRLEALATESNALSAQELVTLALLEHEVRAGLRSFAFDEIRAPFTNDSGFFSSLDYMARGAVIRDGADVAALIARYEAVPNQYADYRAHMRRGIETGWTQPGLVVDRVIAILEAMQVADPADHSLYAPFAALPETIPVAERAALQARAQAAIAQVGAAFADTLAFMTQTYRPAARDTVGASDLPGGRDWYRELVRHFTTLDLTPEQVHALGQAEVARIRGEMNAIIDEVGFEGTFAQFLEFLRTDDQFYAQSEEDLLEKAALIAKRADEQMPRFFGRLPRLSYGVVPVPADIAPAYTTGRYWPGSPTDGRAGLYLVNTYNLRARPLYELPALTLHEGVPGHHHQFALAQEIEDLPEFRKDLYLVAYGEGWGLYAEFVGYEMGAYRTPYERFGALSYEMWRACRLVVDTGLHWLGWTREQAEACFLENSALSPANITTEVERYIAWPGQALAYKVGELKIRELRQRAEAALGADFDVRAFHDLLLLDGAMPLSALEARVDAWIAAQQASD